MKGLAVIGLMLGLLAVSASPGSAIATSTGPSCSDPTDPTCDQHSVTADQAQGDFHGLIMVAGQPNVLDLAAHSGTEPGCGDCQWTLILACLHNNPNDPSGQGVCAGVGQAQQCDKHQSLYRLFLTTKNETNALVAELCLGGVHDVIPVSDLADADVARYLHDVHPPDLTLTVQPPRGVLAGLPAYFTVRPPQALAPETFGGGLVTETITIAPLHYRWDWGDGSAVTTTDDPGAPYPDGTLTHTYARGGPVQGTLTAQWGATYTITAGGQTFGPYDATGGLVSHTQPFGFDVDTAHSHLVSH